MTFSSTSIGVGGLCLTWLLGVVIGYQLALKYPVAMGTDGGILWVPVKTTRGTIVPRAYVHGRFMDTHDTYDCTSSDYNNVCQPALSAFTSKIDLEVVRTIVRDALKTY